jgi:hypothetical protein
MLAGKSQLLPYCPKSADKLVPKSFAELLGRASAMVAPIIKQASSISTVANVINRIIMIPSVNG